MSEDEGTNPVARGVSSGEQSVGEETAADDPSAPEPQGESADQEPESDDDRSSPVPKTSDDVQHLLDRLSEYDDELALEVNGIVETARDLNQTVRDQRSELEDLRERIDEQAETIDALQERLSDRTEELEATETELEERGSRVEELESAYARVQADFQNYKRRAKKRQEQVKERATEDLVGRLVRVRDNLNRALEEESDDVEALREGVEMTLREFDRILEDENVEEIAPEPGADVDPQRHEVMVTVDSALPEGTIDDVFAPGYEMAGKVIRSAQVTVSNGELAAEEDADGETDEDAAKADDDTSTENEDDAAPEFEFQSETESVTDDGDDVPDAGTDGSAADPGDTDEDTDAEEETETQAVDQDEAIELGGEVATDGELESVTDESAAGDEREDESDADGEREDESDASESTDESNDDPREKAETDEPAGDGEAQKSTED